jgi:plasmid stabilization system protein ParE
MVNPERRIVIDEEAIQALRKAYEYIRTQSIQNAEIVRSGILDSIKNLTNHPEIHPPDKYRIDKDKSFRAYELYSYRISYHVSANEIRILRIRNTKMNPVNY